MAVPPEPVIRGARRWLEHIGAAGQPRTWALLAGSREYADLTPTQYGESLVWLHEAGLVGEDGRPAAGSQDPFRIFEALLEASDPAWLADADLLIQSASEIPEDALVAAESLRLDARQALRSIRRTWGKVDLAARTAVGNAGEQLLIGLLQRYTNGDIDHVASWSDSHGYDISLTGGEFESHIEVKTTTRLNRVSFYLSRNEFETMNSDPAWNLSVAVVNDSFRLLRLFTIDREWIRGAAPADVAGGARWDAARFEAPPDARIAGTPFLFPVVTDRLCPLVTGGIADPRAAETASLRTVGAS
jgi:hypothetical protein